MRGWIEAVICISSERAARSSMEGLLCLPSLTREGSRPLVVGVPPSSSAESTVFLSKDRLLILLMTRPILGNAPLELADMAGEEAAGTVETGGPIEPVGLFSGERDSDDERDIEDARKVHCRGTSG
jgi:hypothetical protein